MVERVGFELTVRIRLAPPTSLALLCGIRRRDGDLAARRAGGR
jgi:hypothetical protein